MSFFDEHPVLYPWPDVLRRDNLKFLYKPREVWWKDWIDKMKFKPNEKVLEVGCGRGIFLDRLTGKYKIKASGIDVANKAIKDAQKDGVYKHDLRCGDACKLPFKSNFFDKVVSFDALEHIGNQKQAIVEMARVLKPEGNLLIYTINSNQRFTWNWMLSKLGVDIYSGADHNPKLFLNPEWLKKELKKNSILIKEVGYFDAFFSLAIDELIMLLVGGWRKLFGWEKTKKFARMILVLLSAFSRAVMPVSKTLDLPWTLHGFSNGIIFLGIKR